MTVENLIYLIIVVVGLVSSALIFVILLIFLICKIETCTVGHMHLEAARCETLCLLLVDSCNLFLRMAHGTVVLLGILLHELVLEWLLVDVEFLTVTGNTRLARINGSLHRRDHVKKVSIVLGVSDVIKPGMLQGLFTRDSVGRVHFQKTTH